VLGALRVQPHDGRHDLDTLRLAEPPSPAAQARVYVPRPGMAARTSPSAKRS